MTERYAGWRGGSRLDRRAGPAQDHLHGEARVPLPPAVRPDARAVRRAPAGGPRAARAPASPDPPALPGQHRRGHARAGPAARLARRALVRNARRITRAIVRLTSRILTPPVRRCR